MSAQSGVIASAFGPERGAAIDREIARFPRQSGELEPTMARELNRVFTLAEKEAKKQVKATGTVEEKEGKMVLTAYKIELAGDNK